MFDDEPCVPDKGPWTAEMSQEGRLALSSDDFHHDVQLTVSGDFGSKADKLAYGKYLADILTRGCRRMHASTSLNDQTALLAALATTPAGSDRELLERAADEIARLQVALAEAEATLAQLQAHRYHLRRVSEATAPSAFALALKAALGR